MDEGEHVYSIHPTGPEELNFPITTSPNEISFEILTRPQPIPTLLGWPPLDLQCATVKKADPDKNQRKLPDTLSLEP